MAYQHPAWVLSTPAAIMPAVIRHDGTHTMESLSVLYAGTFPINIVPRLATNSANTPDEKEDPPAKVADEPSWMEPACGIAG